jgi:toxin ParE1/3/4
MVKVIWSKRAFGQFERSITYIKEEQGLSYAKIVVDSILETTRLLCEQPNLGRIENLLAHKKTEYRYIVVWSYKLIYKVEKDKVIISRLFHNSQNPKKLKGV